MSDESQSVERAPDELPIEFSEHDIASAYDRIRAALIARRHAVNMSQRDVAEAAGFAQPYVCNLENGKVRQPGVVNITRWANAVGVTMQVYVSADGVRVTATDAEMT